MPVAPSETSDLIRVAMTFYARGDARVFNALSLWMLQGYSYRRIAGEVKADRDAVRAWCNGFASAGKDYCQLFGVTPAQFARQRAAPVAAAAGG